MIYLTQTKTLWSALVVPNKLFNIGLYFNIPLRLDVNDFAVLACLPLLCRVINSFLPTYCSFSFHSCGPRTTRLKARIQSQEIEPDPRSHPCCPAIVLAHLHHDHQHWDHLILIIVIQLFPSFFLSKVSQYSSHSHRFTIPSFCSNCGERGGEFKWCGGRVKVFGFRCFWVLHY